MAAPRRARPPRQPGPTPRVCAMDTPARRQYLDLKGRHPDAILWFRMGDFYETFDGDAETVERDVVRVVTPGTIVEPNLLAPRENNYLAALLPGREGAGLAYVDVTTAEFAVCQFRPQESQALASELTRIDPAEILCPEGKEDAVRALLPDLALRTSHVALTACPARWFHEPPARERLLGHFGVVSL